MGDKLYVKIPKLDSTLSIVPGSTNLIYELEVDNDKSWPLNNMGRLFVQGLTVKLGRDIIYDNTAESLYRIYEDKWLPAQTRKSLVPFGVTSVEMRKNLSGSNDASSSSKTEGLLDKTMSELMKKQRIKLGQILDDHGLHSPNVSKEIEYTITLPSNSDSVGDCQSSQKVGNFTLKNLELEYDTVRNVDVVQNNFEEMSSGKSYILRHISVESTVEWAKDSTKNSINLHISRESLKALVFLFKWTDQKYDEDYIYPNITQVTVNVNGKPSVIHTTPMLPDKFESEANRLFGHELDDVSSGKFFSTAFSVVLDFRAIAECMKYGDGVKVDGSSGIQVTFDKTATAKNVNVYTFVLSDSIAQVNNSGHQKTIV